MKALFLILLTSTAFALNAPGDRKPFECKGNLSHLQTFSLTGELGQDMMTEVKAESKYTDPWGRVFTYTGLAQYMLPSKASQNVEYRTHQTYELHKLNQINPPGPFKIYSVDTLTVQMPIKARLYSGFTAPLTLTWGKTVFTTNLNCVFKRK